MQPKSNYIFLSKIDTQVSGLIIPPKYQYRADKFHKGKVEAIGRKVTEVVVGDEVAYNKDLGIEVELSEKKFIVIRPQHIFAIV